MYQIFVVEDELLIRQSIRNTIEKMQGPYACCGEASDGEMALSMMQDLMPDILITDIRMPFLDGFGLIRHARAIMPWLKVVVISGYGDFEYTQKAITLDVDQYLLKPVRPADLIQVIEEIASEIEKEKSTPRNPAGFAEDEVRFALQNHFMQQLLYGGTDTGTLLEQSRTLHLDIIRSNYQVVLCLFDAPGTDLSALRPAARNLLTNTEQILYYFNEADLLTIIFCNNDRDALDERTYLLINILKHELKELCPIITTVIGSKVQRLGEINRAYLDALNMLKKISTVAAGQVINADDTAQITADIVRFSGPFSDTLQQRLQYSSAEDVPALLDEILSEEGGDQFGSTLIRYHALVYLLKVSVHIIADNSPGEDEDAIADRISSSYNIFESSGQYDTFRKTAQEMLQTALATKKSKYVEVKYSHVISLAEKYLLENFCDPNISLLSTAHHVGMSPAHFSTIFSQKLGKTFINYLTSLRMEKAKELLTSTNRKLSEIALDVGYNEPNYFSHVFRKMEGITPKEYRNRATGQ